MRNLLLTGAVALGMMTTTVMAQTVTKQSTSETTMTMTAMPYYSSPVSSSIAVTTGRGATPDGDQSAWAETSWRDYNGTTGDIRIIKTTYPLSNIITTQRTTTMVSNGVASESVLFTTNYPPSYNEPATVTTAARTYVVGAK
jgi:hypothetical protein